MFTVSCHGSLVYRDKISCPWVWGFPSNEGVKEGYPLQRRYFAVIGSYSEKTVADTDMLLIMAGFLDINIDDLERP